MLAALVLTLAAAAQNSTPVKVKIEGQDLFAIGFDRLAAFEYVVTDAGTGASEEEIEAAKKKDQIPTWARFYDGKKVALTGFLMPLKLEGGVTSKFIMMRDITTCCYGNVPNMNEYVIVTMAGPGVSTMR